MRLVVRRQEAETLTPRIAARKKYYLKQFRAVIIPCPIGKQMESHHPRRCIKARRSEWKEKGGMLIKGARE